MNNKNNKLLIRINNTQLYLLKQKIAIVLYLEICKQITYI